MKHNIATLLFLSGLTLTAHATCYTVYDQNDVIIVRSIKSPVDLSPPISSAVRARFPNGHLITADSTGCTEIDNTVRTNANSNPDRSRAGIANSAELLFTAEYVNADSASKYELNDGSSYKRSANAGNDVHVKEYRKADGTVVGAYDRAARGRGRK